MEVDNLKVDFINGKKITNAVKGVSFNLQKEKLAIVGESGSGKSTIGRAILKLHPSSAIITANKLQFKEVDLLNANDKMMHKIRGRRISMIMQDPKYSLNPLMRVGDQIAESYRQHNKISKSEAKRKVLDILDEVRIRDPQRVYHLYPHEVSGGQGQRIMIAMMLITEPEIIIADEPTSALDVSVRLQVLNMLDDLVKERGLGLIFISHDINLVRSFCDRVLVMYSGRIVESIPARELENAQHPYTKGLLDSLPDIDNKRERLPVLVRDPNWLVS
ncbi:ABC transporter ATP-binding protein [uncultured Gilliamella sp.]|uniref:ABC transporter ATP-binding protein n=1 Tax=uncultured Gilliamella sp. TaxID=1193505 RepID=UPI003457552F